MNYTGIDAGASGDGLTRKALVLIASIGVVTVNP